MVGVSEESQAIDLSLVGRVRAGDRAAAEELVAKYMPMVRRIAGSYFARSYEFDDLVQEGLMGLLAAIREYEPGRYGVKFSSFAYLCVVRKVYSVIKRSNGVKERPLNEALSLHMPASPTASPSDGRALLDVVAPPGSWCDPEAQVLERLSTQELGRVLREHLSLLEYTVAVLLVAGYTSAEIERAVGVAAKVVDNARTRVKLKLARLLTGYGSLLAADLPPRRRRRPDLCLQVTVRLREA